MKPKRKRRPPPPAKPGIALKHLRDEYGTLPPEKESLKKGHVLLLFYENEKLVAQTVRALSELLPGAYTSANFIRPLIKRFESYKNLGRDNEKVRYVDFCGESFTSFSPPDQQEPEGTADTDHNTDLVQAHPSVRMKGTEEHWHPVNCTGFTCDIMGVPHMHCPMCTKEFHYTDPVILKAHYRVKHVDKGVEFAGLKILRCCRSCEIIGVISGYKDFKGPHWHCYRCRNGFNRKDEALKHFKTHFKNPQTTFQIQIVQDINQSVSLDGHQKSSSNSSLVMGATPTTISLPSLCHASGSRLMTVTSQQETALATNGISVAANETIDSNTETIVLIETTDGNLPPSVHSLQAKPWVPALVESETACPDNHISKANLILVQDKMKLEQQVEQLQRDKIDMKHRYKIENQRLKARIDQLTLFNSNLKQQLETLRKASAEHLPDSDQSELEQLVKHMEEQHSQLMRHHLGQLRLYWNAQQTASVNHELQESVITSPQNMHNSGMARQPTVHIIPVTTAEALEDMVSQGEENQQNSAALTLSRDVTMETAEGSYQVTLLPNSESAHHLGDTETGASSDMTTLSSVSVPYSDDRTLEENTNGAELDIHIVNESRCDDDSVCNVQVNGDHNIERSAKKRSTQDDVVKLQNAKKTKLQMMITE